MQPITLHTLGDRNSKKKFLRLNNYLKYAPRIEQFDSNINIKDLTYNVNFKHIQLTLEYIIKVNLLLNDQTHQSLSLY